MKRGARIERDFFERDPLTCAAALIGCELVWDDCSGIIVETEAYSTKDDEACHTFARKGAREFVATHQPGAAYVYLNYGIHWLLNVLVKGGREEGFVLIRALEPVKGIEKMRRRRMRQNLTALCSGPGKLSEALGVRGTDHGIDLCAGGGRGFRAPAGPVTVVSDVRIGISKAAHLPWRFLLKGSPHVSVHPKPPRAAGKPRKK
ncbi:MAG TPA: DNA-3-methyladenine glycosylase [Chthoniobacteraceae bacterium]|nr:DNA-3-methyladenine glycosylase [Chthoniobacteraceae bacterium]